MVLSPQGSATSLDSSSTDLVRPTPTLSAVRSLDAESLDTGALNAATTIELRVILHELGVFLADEKPAQRRAHGDSASSAERRSRGDSVASGRSVSSAGTGLSGREYHSLKDIQTVARNMVALSPDELRRSVGIIEALVLSCRGTARGLPVVYARKLYAVVTRCSRLCAIQDDLEAAHRRKPAPKAGGARAAAAGGGEGGGEGGEGAATPSSRRIKVSRRRAGTVTRRQMSHATTTIDDDPEASPESWFDEEDVAMHKAAALAHMARRLPPCSRE